MLFPKSILLIAALCLSLDLAAGEVREISVIGNSLRRHHLKPSIGWNHEWGMAAGSEDKDYTHLLYRKIGDKFKAAGKPEPTLTLPPRSVIAEADWSSWDAPATKSADVLIIQLGDNFRPKEDFDPQRDFIAPYTKMLTDMKAVNPDRILICVSNWDDDKKFNWLHTAAKAAGVPFVDINKLSKDRKNRAASEGRFTHNSVNWHPGDRGMAVIADAIWAVLEPELDRKIFTTTEGEPKR